MIATGALGGCSVAGAPSFELFGAFFPAWMFCAGVGILGALAARIVFTSPHWKPAIPLQLSVCTAVGVLFALIIWLSLFR